MEEVIDFKNPAYGNKLIWEEIVGGKLEFFTPAGFDREWVSYKNAKAFPGLSTEKHSPSPFEIDRLWYAWDCVAKSYRKDQLGITLFDTKGVVLNWGDLMVEVYDLQSRHEVLWTLLCELALIAKASKES